MKRGVIATGLALLAFAVPALAAQPTSSATIAVSKSTVTIGSPVTITGQVTGKKAAGATVTLQSLPAPYSGAYATVTNATADSTGHYTFTVKPAISTDYRVLGKTAPTATSPVAKVNVRVAVSSHVSTSKPAKGAMVKFSGFVTPAYNGKEVSIQRKTASGWKTIAHAKLATATASGGLTRSKYSRRVKVSKSGTFRVWFNPADGRLLANASPTHKLTVH
jgi:hypothetical protein